jgi:chemotaxis protein histidine kinase CheA
MTNPIDPDAPEVKPPLPMPGKAKPERIFKVLLTKKVPPANAGEVIGVKESMARALLKADACEPLEDFAVLIELEYVSALRVQGFGEKLAKECYARKIPVDTAALDGADEMLRQMLELRDKEEALKPPDPEKAKAAEEKAAEEKAAEEKAAEEKAAEEKAAEEKAAEEKAAEEKAAEEKAAEEKAAEEAKEKSEVDTKKAAPPQSDKMQRPGTTKDKGGGKKK